jgi:uncharacterized protein (DUF427 family)
MSTSHPQFTARIEGAPETIFDLIADMPNYGDHPITIERNLKRVVVSVGDAVLSDSRDALILREAGYPAVQYIPRKDVDMTLLERSAHATYCPYKGDCAYFSIPSGGGARHQRRVDLRSSLRRGGHQEPLGVLPRQGGRHRGAFRKLGRSAGLPIQNLRRPKMSDAAEYTPPKAEFTASCASSRRLRRRPASSRAAVVLWRSRAPANLMTRLRRSSR